MDHTSGKCVLRGVALTPDRLFFLFPIFWIFLMSFQTNEDILRIPPSLFFTPTLHQLRGADHRQAADHGGTLDHRLHAEPLEQRAASTRLGRLALLLGVPAAYAFARFKFRLGEDIAFTLLSFRFAPPLLVLLPLPLYFQNIGLDDTYVGLIWVYQLIALPLILWIVRGYFEDISPDIELRLSHRRPFLAAAPSRASPFRWRGPGSRRRDCSPSSSAGTISSSR